MGPVVKIPCFQGRGQEFNRLTGNQDLSGTQSGKKKKKKIDDDFTIGELILLPQIKKLTVTNIEVQCVTCMLSV